MAVDQEIARFNFQIGAVKKLENVSRYSYFMRFLLLVTSFCRPVAAKLNDRQLFEEMC